MVGSEDHLEIYNKSSVWGDGYISFSSTGAAHEMRLLTDVSILDIVKDVDLLINLLLQIYIYI